ncbi:HNH endonuclease family protein [Kocuria rosea]|uniref:HNH endonuclease n=1 Tax=Kocuria rosea TaxID=1275 RepID=UPI00068B6B16|nr:HNH endonuclease [Kocuria polaris]
MTTIPAPASTCVHRDGCDSTEIMSRNLCRRHYSKASRAGELDLYPRRTTDQRGLTHCQAAFKDGSHCTRTDVTMYGLCSGHANQRSEGRPITPLRKANQGSRTQLLPGLSSYSTPIQWALDRVTITEGGCWIWTKYTDPEGYAIGRPEGRTVRVHRWLHEQVNGPIPADWDCDHACSSPGCISPLHTKPLPKLSHYAVTATRKELRKLWSELAPAGGAAILDRQLQPALFRMSTAWLVAQG